MHRYREQTDSSQRGGGLVDWVKKVKGLSKTEQNQSLIDTGYSVVIAAGEGFGGSSRAQKEDEC